MNEKEVENRECGRCGIQIGDEAFRDCGEFLICAKCNREIADAKPNRFRRDMNNKETEAIELLPCPFCGLDAVVVNEKYDYISCSSAGKNFCYLSTVQWRREFWNTRAETDRLTAVLNKLGVEVLEEGDYQFKPSMMDKFRKSQNDTEHDRLTAENAALKAERRWIPVEERLPDKIGDVLVTTPDRVVRKVYFWHGDRRFDFKGRDAIAWMPLPEPYNPDLAVLDELTEIRLKLR